MMEPLISTIDVPCAQKQAFEVFTEQMGRWWPLAKRSMSLKDGQQPKALNVEAREGGQLVEVSSDGTEYHWGTYTKFDPNDYLRMDFHMGLPSHMASLVEVRFNPVDDGKTRVTLTQSNFEAFGDMAEMMRGGYGSGWVLIFEQGYAQACQ